MQTKNRKMKAGEALVGMKRRGSQLEEDGGCQLFWPISLFDRYVQFRGEGEVKEGRGVLGWWRPGWLAYLRRQNMLAAAVVVVGCGKDRRTICYSSNVLDSPLDGMGWADTMSG